MQLSYHFYMKDYIYIYINRRIIIKLLYKKRRLLDYEYL